MYLCSMTKAEKTRQFIIEQSAPIFNTKGIVATSMSDIMEATKLAKGSLYVHFENKDELSYAAVDYNLNAFLERTIAEADKYTTAKEKFFALLDYLGDPLNPPVKGGCPMMNFGMEADDTSPVIREKVHKLICSVQEGMTLMIQKGIADGEFKKDWDPVVFATKAYAMVEGGILISRVSGEITQMQMLIGLLKKEMNENTL
jgi:TetR/AcrR family transcriptional repressor of nem operon